MNGFVWSVFLCRAEKERSLQAFDVWTRKDRVTNEEVLAKVGEKK